MTVGKVYSRWQRSGHKEQSARWSSDGCVRNWLTQKLSLAMRVSNPMHVSAYSSSCKAHAERSRFSFLAVHCPVSRSICLLLGPFLVKLMFGDFIEHLISLWIGDLSHNKTFSRSSRPTQSSVIGDTPLSRLLIRRAELLLVIPDRYLSVVVVPAAAELKSRSLQVLRPIRASALSDLHRQSRSQRAFARAPAIDNSGRSQI